jgi:hypothetical protein
VLDHEASIHINNSRGEVREVGRRFPECSRDSEHVIGMFRDVIGMFLVLGIFFAVYLGMA